MPTLATETSAAMTRLLRASWRNETGFCVGCLITCAKASRVAPGGIRLRPSGRAMLRGSRAMLTIQTIGKSTVTVMSRQRTCRSAWRRMVRALRWRLRVLTRAPAIAAGAAPTWLVIVRTPSSGSGRGLVAGHASNCAVALAIRLVTRVIASRMKNWKTANAAATVELLLVDEPVRRRDQQLGLPEGTATGHEVREVEEVEGDDELSLIHISEPTRLG